MSNYLQVEGNPSLVREVSSGAIINNNYSEYENYVKNRDIALARKTQAERNTEDINILKQDMNEIKQMLQLLIKSKED
jgi:hypothetical protein